MSWYNDCVSFSELIGKTLIKIDVSDYQIDFECSDGSKYYMTHFQDCCESVYIESIDGDIQRLLGQPILVAEESSNSDDPPSDDYWIDSFTWTFYKLRTNLDSVTIRWLGQSNGYYSEGVDFCKREGA